MGSVLAAVQPANTFRPPIEPLAVYSKDEAALVTGTSYSTIHRAIESGKLRVARINRRVAIRGEELLRWIVTAEEGGTSRA